MPAFDNFSEINAYYNYLIPEVKILILEKYFVSL